MPPKVNTPTTTPTPQAPSQNLLRGNVVPPARSKIRDLMEKFEREQFKNDVDDLEKPPPMQRVLLPKEEKLITRSTASTTISSEEKHDHKIEVKFELDVSEDDMVCKEEIRRQHSKPRSDNLHDGNTSNSLAVHTVCATTSSKVTPKISNQTARQASSQRLLSASIFAQQCPTVE